MEILCHKSLYTSMDYANRNKNLDPLVQIVSLGNIRGLQVIQYNQTSLIHASLIRMPHNPNLFSHFLFTIIQ